MENIKSSLQSLIKGDVEDTAEVKEFFSHDASMFELVPEVVVAPRDTEDIKRLVSYVAQNKAHQPQLSLTVRSGGKIKTIND